MQVLQPPGWARAKGFSNGIAASGRLVFIAGQIGWTGEGKWEARDFAGQFRQTLKNIIEVLAQYPGASAEVLSESVTQPPAASTTSLPLTGADVLPLISVGVGALIAGMVVLRAASRRRRSC